MSTQRVVGTQPSNAHSQHRHPGQEELPPVGAILHSYGHDVSSTKRPLVPEHYPYRVMTSTMSEKEFYLHPSSKWHFYDKLRGRRLAEPLKSHTVLSPFQSALYKIQASIQTEETREQEEHSVSLLCIFLEDDTKYCFSKLLTFYFIIHRYTNRSLNALLAQNF